MGSKTIIQRQTPVQVNEKSIKHIFPDIASIMLDSEARKVHYTVDFDEEEITGKLTREKITALKEHKINVKILATNKGKIYVVYSDPLKLTHSID